MRRLESGDKVESCPSYKVTLVLEEDEKSTRYGQHHGLNRTVGRCEDGVRKTLQQRAQESLAGRLCAEPEDGSNSATAKGRDPLARCRVESLRHAEQRNENPAVLPWRNYQSLLLCNYLRTAGKTLTYIILRGRDCIYLEEASELDLERQINQAFLPEHPCTHQSGGGGERETGHPHFSTLSGFRTCTHTRPVWFFKPLGLGL